MGNIIEKQRRLTYSFIVINHCDSTASVIV